MDLNITSSLTLNLAQHVCDERRTLHLPILGVNRILNPQTMNTIKTVQIRRIRTGIEINTQKDAENVIQVMHYLILFYPLCHPGD